VVDWRAMKAHVISALVLGCALPLAAQTPAPATTPPANSSDLGFTYNLPGGWEILNMAPMVPAAKQQEEQQASSDAEKKGASCSQIYLTARHGSPASVIVVVTLPWDCFGQAFTSKDLPSFGEGAAGGLVQNFNVATPVYGAYALGSHDLWIERVQGSAKDDPQSQYTIELACTILKKAAVCWMTLASDSTALASFENSTVSLEGETATALVPASAFQTPSQ